MPRPSFPSDTIGAIVFDGDDTLWDTESLYDRARLDAGQIVASAGLDPTEFDSLQRSIDARNVRTMGFSAERFPASSVEAVRVLAERSGTALNPDVLVQVHLAAKGVFDLTAAVFPFAEKVLSVLSVSYPLALLTKGEEYVQLGRIEASHLGRYFERIEVVSEKDETVLRRLLTRIGAVPNLSWAVGNSVPSDLAPALDAGMQAIWIEADVWSHERRTHGVDLANPRLRIVSGLEQVPAIFGLPDPE